MLGKPTSPQVQKLVISNFIQGLLGRKIANQLGMPKSTMIDIFQKVRNH